MQLFTIVFDFADIIFDAYFCYIATGNVKIIALIFFGISFLLFAILLFKTCTKVFRKKDSCSNYVYEFAVAFTFKHIDDDAVNYEDTFMLKMLIVLFEDIPMFIVQLIYTLNSDINWVVIISICISCRSILSKLLYGIVFICGCYD